MDKALEPIKPNPVYETQYWCVDCSAPVVVSEFKPVPWDHFVTRKVEPYNRCPKCFKRGGPFAQTTRNWSHIPLILVVQYGTVSAPIIAFIGYMLLFGIVEVVKWVL